jgi:hypothetical protein
MIVTTDDDYSEGGSIEVELLIIGLDTKEDNDYFDND